MIPTRIEGHTRYLGKPVGWEPDGPAGDCSSLAIRDEEFDGLPVMSSVWEPTPAELERLNAGAKVVLTVIGTAHPPVAVQVSTPPEGA